MKQRRKKQKTLRFRIEVGFTWHPAIDPDDALNYVKARMIRKIRSHRGKLTPDDVARAGEDLWLASVANTKKWNPDIIATIQEQVQRRGRKFLKRLNDAIFGRHPRVPKPDSVEDFMLRNERKFDNPNPEWKRQPGLRDWHPRAAIKLMKAVVAGKDSGRIPNSANSYNKKRRAIGLSPQPKGKRDYLVIDFRSIGDGQYEIVTSD